MSLLRSNFTMAQLQTRSGRQSDPAELGALLTQKADLLTHPALLTSSVLLAHLLLVHVASAQLYSVCQNAELIQSYRFGFQWKICVSTSGI